MKKAFLLIYLSCVFSSIFFLNGCNRNDIYLEISETEKQLNLKSPSGKYIATDIKILKKELGRIIETAYGEDKDFRIISIQYDNEKEGFSADITYRTDDGIESNVIATYNPIKSKSRSEGGEASTGNSYWKCRIWNYNKCQQCRTVKKNGQIYCACDKGFAEGCALYENRY